MSDVTRILKEIESGDPQAAERLLPLTAAEDAKPVAGQQISVMANVSVNFVMKMTYSSPPCFVTVADPAVAAVD